MPHYIHTEADVKAGKLDGLAEKALGDYTLSGVRPDRFRFSSILR